MRRASDRAHHIVYKTTCQVTGRYYIGMHSTDDLGDGYLGSGVRLGRSIKKHGRDQHCRVILEELPSRLAASDREKELISDEVRADPQCMNCAPGGMGATDRPATKEETCKKLSSTSTARWSRDRQKLREVLDEELKNFKLTREQILEVLLTKDGHLNKNITRHLSDPVKRKGREGLLNRVAALNTAKWNFIHKAIQNPEFGDDPVELINAYVLNLEFRPKCRTCGGKVSFFRFNRPYASYCGNSCQLLDPNFKNPVLTRWERTGSL